MVTIIRKMRHEARHRVLGGPPPFQAKPADEPVKLGRKGDFVLLPNNSFEADGFANA